MNIPCSKGSFPETTYFCIASGNDNTIWKISVDGQISPYLDVTLKFSLDFKQDY